MSIREIPSSEWQPFLERFGREHRAWLATIDSGRGEEMHAERMHRHLRSIIPVVDAGRVVRIEIRFQHDSEAGGSISVTAPVSVHVDETAAGSAQGLEIADRDGGCTRIRFRAAPPLDQLDGIAPGEE